MESSSAKQADEAAGSYLVDVPKILDATGRLFELIWSRSPVLASFVVVMVVLLPFYWRYTAIRIGPAERAADKKVDDAHQARKKRAKQERKGG